VPNDRASTAPLLPTEANAKAMAPTREPVENVRGEEKEEATDATNNLSPNTTQGKP
jgi:hypothetical protein